MRALVLLFVIACGSSDAGTSPSSSTASAAAAATATSSPTTSTSAAPASSLPWGLPPTSTAWTVARRSAFIVSAKAAKLGLRVDDEGDKKAPQPDADVDILKAYVENSLGADKKFKGKPAHIGGEVQEVGKDGDRAFVLTGPNEKDLREQLAVKAKKLRLFLDRVDGVSLDVATELKKGEVILAVCVEGIGEEFGYVSFDGCTIFSGAQAEPPPASSSRR